MNELLMKLRVLFELSHSFDKRNRKRNVSLVLTIAFSVVALFSLLSLVRGRAIADELRAMRENGTCASFILDNVSEEQYQILYGLGYVDESAICHGFGTWYFGDKKVAKCVTVNNEGFSKLFMPAFENVTGEYPESPEEIMVSMRILRTLGIEDPVLGMEIPAYIVPLDWLMNQTRAIDSSFRLSGYYTDYINDIERLPQAFFSEKLPEQKSLTTFDNDAFMKSDNLWMNATQLERRINFDVVLNADQNISVVNEGISKTLKDMTGNCVFAFLGVLIIILSMNLFVYNIFSISFHEEKREYGLLKVLGAEPKQIKVMFAISEIKTLLVGSAIGVVLGCLSVMGVLPKLTGKMYLEGSGSISADEIWSVKLLVASAILCGVGEIVAFVKCTDKIMKLSPIECSKYEEEISIPIISSKPQKELGIFGIAIRNFGRNRTKMLITVISLFIGIEVLPNTYYLISKSDHLAKEQSYISAVRIIMGSFSGILIVFALVSYYNTLLTGYYGRKKEFSIMRKIGMTKKQLRKMLIYEGILYYTSAMVLVLTLGSLIIYGIGIVIKNKVEYFLLEYPWAVVFGTIMIVLGVSICTPLFMYYDDVLLQMKKADV